MIKSCLWTLCLSFNLCVEYVCSVHALATCTFVSPMSDFAECLLVCELIFVYLQPPRWCEYNSVVHFDLNVVRKMKLCFKALKKEGTQNTQNSCQALMCATSWSNDDLLGKYKEKYSSNDTFIYWTSMTPQNTQHTALVQRCFELKAIIMLTCSQWKCWNTDFLQV